MNQDEFLAGLETALKLARANNNQISEEQIAEIFGNVASDEKHREILMAYFKSKGITAGAVSDEEAEDAVIREFAFDPKDKAYLDEYLSGLEEIEILTESELVQLLLRAGERDQEAKSKILEQYLSKAADLARTYAGQGIFMEDLIGEANLALTEAIMELENYIDAQGSVETLLTDVEGYLGERMMDALESMIREEMADQQADRDMAGKVNLVADAARSLAMDLGHKPDIGELTQNTQLTKEDVMRAIRILGNSSGDLDIRQDETQD